MKKKELIRYGDLTWQLKTVVLFGWVCFVFVSLMMLVGFIEGIIIGLRTI